MPTDPVTPTDPLDSLRARLRDALHEHTPDNVGWTRVRKVVDDVMPVIEAMVLSNRSVNDVRLTWQEHADRLTVERNRLSALAEVLMDLDRCEHGRHEGDDCFGCAEKIAGAASMGNPWAEAGTRRIGTLMSGKPIVIPAAHSDSRDPAAWRG